MTTCSLMEEAMTKANVPKLINDIEVCKKRIEELEAKEADEREKLGNTRDRYLWTLQDTIAADGQLKVAEEIGLLVLGAIDDAQRSGR